MTGMKLQQQYFDDDYKILCRVYEPARKTVAERGFLTLPEILEFWKMNKSKMPLFAALTRPFLSVLQSSAPSERVFSTAGNTVINKRCSLTLKTTESLVSVR